MHMSQDCRQSTLKALLNNLEMHQEIHTMTTRYENHDTEDTLDSGFPGSCTTRPHYVWRKQWIIWWIQWRTDTLPPLAELPEQFWHLQDQFANLKSATDPLKPMTELTQLTDKLQKLTMILQQPQAPQPNREPVHKTMQTYMDTLQATQREANPTMTLLQDIPMFNRQDSSKLDDWFMDIETATDI